MAQRSCELLGCTSRPNPSPALPRRRFPLLQRFCVRVAVRAAMLDEEQAALIADSLRENAGRAARMEGVLGCRDPGYGLDITHSEQGPSSDLGEGRFSMLASTLKPLMGSPLLLSVTRLRLVDWSLEVPTSLGSLFPCLQELDLSFSCVPRPVLLEAVLLPQVRLLHVSISIDLQHDLKELMHTCRTARGMRAAGSLLEVQVELDRSTPHGDMDEEDEENIEYFREDGRDLRFEYEGGTVHLYVASEVPIVP